MTSMPVTDLTREEIEDLRVLILAAEALQLIKAESFIIWECELLCD